MSFLHTFIHCISNCNWRGKQVSEHICFKHIELFSTQAGNERGQSGGGSDGDSVYD